MVDPDSPGDGAVARDRGRAAYRDRGWAEAFAALHAADRASPLDPADLDLLVSAAYLVGRDDDGAGLGARAYRLWVGRAEPARAARCAFWLALHALLRGEAARGQGWLSRAQAVLDDAGLDCAERGLLLVPDGLVQLACGDAAAARGAFGAALEIGERFGDPDLVAFGRLGLGQALIRLGDAVQGVACLDEVMVAVVADEVSPVAAGIVYCAVIEECQHVFDLRRAREWTVALARWCAAQPDLVPYRGQCLLHRAEIMALHGGWPDALDEARRACDQLTGQPAAGAAFYQLGELHRLRGELGAAERAFLQASRWMPDPQPGLALLRLRQGRTDVAAAASRRAVSEATEPAVRVGLLGAHVEIMIAAGDPVAARAAADELDELAAALDTPWLHAVARRAGGACLIAEHDGQAAVDVLRRAWADWQELDAPYEAARVRVQMGLAYRELGEPDVAAMEFDAAAWVFEQLGAGPDLEEARELARPGRPACGLTARELQVLRLVAAGLPNRVIAAELFLSGKTVARHISNIFTKLDVRSRAAATAYAYQHGLA